MLSTLEKVHIPALNVSEGGEKGGRIRKVCLLGSEWRAGLSFREVWFCKHVFPITGLIALVQMAQHLFFFELHRVKEKCGLGEDTNDVKVT